MPATVILRGPVQIAHAKRLLDAAPVGAVVTISPPKRNLDQNAKLWSMLTDISIAQPEGRRHTTEVWKCLFMQACGHAVQFETGLDGTPFPVGFRSSRLTVAQMRDLIEFVYQKGAEWGIKWSDEYGREDVE
jgi:hypothetical protein